jgi:hypothetical protein
MAGSEMTQALEATLTILKNCGQELAFLDLVRRVIATTNADEATVKASILRLSAEGQAEITSDWSVRLPREESHAESEAAAA